MLTFHEIGDWREGQVQITWAPSGRVSRPEVDALIEQAWEDVGRRPGVHLFDGPMCRLEDWTATPLALELVFSRTSYKPFLGTNLYHPELADRFGREVMANPVGVSPALVSRDGFLLFGQRNGSVAYYPNRLHPFSGAIEPRDVMDVFSAVRRELAEELNLEHEDIAEIRCLGIVEDKVIRHPELIFLATSTLDRAQIESDLDPEEHSSCRAVPATQAALESALEEQETFTPIGRAALLLWGRKTFGPAWFDRAVK